MNSSLKSGEKLPRAVRRIAKKRLVRVLIHLAPNRSGRPGDPIHEARKQLKKVRALLRLVRDALPSAVCRRAEIRFRTISRALSRPRDAEVLLHILEMLSADNTSKTASLGAKLQEKLRVRQTGVFRDWHAQARRLRAALLVERSRIRDWPVDSLDWPHLCRAVTRSYKRGRKSFRQSLQSRASDDLHQWRKRLKDLWYQLRLIEPIHPGFLHNFIRRLKRLSEMLGYDHDLAMLLKTAAAGLTRAEMNSLAKLVQVRRDRLQRDAFKLGQRLYAEKPAVFSRRIRRHARNWR